MILNIIYICKDFYIFNQIKSKPKYLLLSLDATNLYIKGFCHLIILDFY